MSRNSSHVEGDCPHYQELLKISFVIFEHNLIVHFHRPIRKRAGGLLRVTLKRG